MKTIVLIIIIKLGNANSISSTVTEFNSFDNCNEAAISIIKQLDEKRPNYVTVISYGCYEK